MQQALVQEADGWSSCSQEAPAPKQYGHHFVFPSLSHFWNHQPSFWLMPAWYLLRKYPRLVGSAWEWTLLLTLALD